MEKFKIELLNENDFKIEIFEATKHTREFADMILKFCQQNRQFLDGDLHMHLFPTLVFIIEEDENANEELKKEVERCPLISKQQVYVLGELSDRIIVATNDDYIQIHNRNAANLNYDGFTISIDKNNNDICVSEYDAQSGFFNRYSTKEEKHDKHPLLSMFPPRNQPEPEIVLERCFSKINSVSNINEFVDLNQIKNLVVNRLLEKKEAQQEPSAPPKKIKS